MPSSNLSLRDTALAVLVVFIWGTNFVVVVWGLNMLPPLIMAAFQPLASLPVKCQTAARKMRPPSSG